MVILHPVHAGMCMNSGRIVVGGMFWKKEEGKEGRRDRPTDRGGESSSESAKWEEEGDHPANERCYSCGWVGW